MHPYEVTSSTRRVTRRSLGLPCELLSNESGIRREHMLDLSTRGASVTATSELALGEEVLLSFTPPGLTLAVEAVARVAHVAMPKLPFWQTSRGIAGLEFNPLPASLLRDIERSLRGLPPPLPLPRKHLELAWLDLEVSWEEELDDRVNVVSLSERMTLVDDGEDLIEVRTPGVAMRLPVHIRT